MKKFLIIVISVFSANITMSQNSFEIYFQDGNSNYADIVINIPDGNSFVNVSKNKPYAMWPATDTFYIYKVSPTGDTSRWEYHKQDTLIMYDQMKYDKYTGNILVFGRGYRLIDNGATAVEPFMWLGSLTTELELNWERMYHLIPQDYIYTYYAEFLQLSETEFIIADYAYKPIGGPGKTSFILKFNINGDSLQFKSFPSYSCGEINSLTFNPDSTAIWLHYVKSIPDNCNCLCDVLNIDTFDSITTFYYPYQQNNLIYFSHPYSAKIMPDNSFVAASMYDVYTTQSISYIGAFKFDSEFNVLVEDLLTEGIGPENLQAYTATDNCIDYVYPDQIYVGGSYWVPPGSFNSNDCWVYVAKLDEDMNMLWEKYLGGDAMYRTDGMCATYDGGVILTGKRYDENINYHEYDGFLYKLDSNGYVNVAENSNLKVKNAIVYPNPVKGNKVFLRTALRNASFYIYELSGRQVLELPVNELITSVDIDLLKTGEYVWTVKSTDKVLETGKLIKQ